MIDFEKIAWRIAALNRNLKVHTVIWDEIGQEWSDFGVVSVNTTDTHFQRVAIALNRATEAVIDPSFDADDSTMEPEWRVVRANRSDDLSKVTPGNTLGKEFLQSEQRHIEEAKADGEPTPVFTQSTLKGPGYWAEMSNGRHRGLMLFQY